MKSHAPKVLHHGELDHVRHTRQSKLAKSHHVVLTLDKGVG